MKTYNRINEDKEYSDPNNKLESISCLNSQSVHKLNSEWVFWYASRKERQVDFPYNERLMKIGSFSNIEDFFQYYLYLKSASDVDRHTDLALFKKGHKPLWEECPNGGVWFFRMKKNDDPTEKDLCWEKLVFALIGEQFDEPSILGAVLSVRARETIFELWFNYNKNQELKKEIVKDLSKIIEVDRSTLFFKDNAISLQVNIII